MSLLHSSFFRHLSYAYAHLYLFVRAFEDCWLCSQLSKVMITRTPPLATLVRCFSSTARAQKHVSHIGREPIKYSPKVILTPSLTAITIQGPLGTTSVPLQPYMKIEFPEENTVAVSVEDAEIKVQRQMWGTTRTLISNAIIGMTDGFTVPLYLVGVGYRVAIETDPRADIEGGSGQRLSMKLGYSHTVYVPIPSHIKAEVPSATKIVLSCTDKHLLGLFAAKVRGYRKPEPYKGKVSFSPVWTIYSISTMTRASLLVTNKSVLKASKRSNKTIKIIKLLCCIWRFPHHWPTVFPLRAVLPQEVCAGDACSLLPSSRSTLAKYNEVHWDKFSALKLNLLPFLISAHRSDDTQILQTSTP